MHVIVQAHTKRLGKYGQISMDVHYIFQRQRHLFFDEPGTPYFEVQIFIHLLYNGVNTKQQKK